MEWAEAISAAINYIESHITDNITLYDVADHVNISPFYFQKGFSILCGYSIAEYMRNRRMALAGKELITSDITVMELAMKYGYDSPDSFTKAFSRSQTTGSLRSTIFLALFTVLTMPRSMSLRITNGL